MSIGNFGLYRQDGRLRGSYVYMLLCRDDGPIYVKVGITDRPDSRMMALRLGCPVAPRQFCTMEVVSRRKARTIEVDLHAAFARWSAHGEWFKVDLADKEKFNEAWKQVLGRHVMAGWPCAWSKVAVQPVMDAKHRAQKYRLKVLLRRGPAYQDFTRHARND